MKNKIKYKTAIIGTGRIGFLLQKDRKREQPAAHSRAFAENKSIDIVAGCDIDNDKILQWSRYYPKATIYANFHKLMEEENPDIVIIAVNESAHLDVVLKTIKYRPRLIVLEKPVAANLDDAEKIEKYALKKNVPICINHERRFSQDYLIVKDMLESNKIGVLHSVNARLWSGMPVWKKGCKKTGACSLIHDGTHLVDIVHFLFNVNLKKPKIDKAVKFSNGKVDSLFLHYDIGKEKILFFEMSGNKKYFGFEIDVVGSSGRIVIGNGYLKLYERRESPYYSGFYSLIKNKRLKRPRKTGYFKNMVQNCVDFLDGNSRLLSPISEGVKTVRVLSKIIEKLND